MNDYRKPPGHIKGGARSSNLAFGWIVLCICRSSGRRSREAFFSLSTLCKPGRLRGWSSQASLPRLAAPAAAETLRFSHSRLMPLLHQPSSSSRPSEGAHFREVSLTLCPLGCLHVASRWRHCLPCMPLSTPHPSPDHTLSIPASRRRADARRVTSCLLSSAGVSFAMHVLTCRGL